MNSKEELLYRIKKSVTDSVPDAVIILYGSYARNEEKSESDIDILILIKAELFNKETEKKIKYPLYDIEFDTVKIISPLVFPENEWYTLHKITPFYKSVMKEGIVL